MLYAFRSSDVLEYKRSIFSQEWNGIKQREDDEDGLVCSLVVRNGTIALPTIPSLSESSFCSSFHGTCFPHFCPLRPWSRTLQAALTTTTRIKFADRSSEESLVQLTGSVDPADNLRWSIQVYKAVKDTNTGGSSAEKDGETYSQGIMEELKSKDRWVSRAILYKRFHESSTI
ncbi:uncharacterized protein LOC116189280 isoform X2 [Punica granatum]|uniref:Uncharacterized protein LOC116189280 isoform X2 n=1 Tax=Punica granatum TaxID=22663 RepID=A0A6P8BZZ0_PUNGR|nr:uncharacterized protein LOC116189280 isoform X2 [Punica granatum]